MDEFDKIGLVYTSKLINTGLIPRTYIIRQRGKKKVKVEVTDEFARSEINLILDTLDEQINEK